MRFLALFAVVVATVVAAGCGKPPLTPTAASASGETKDDLTELAGEWKLTKVDTAGLRPPPAEMVGMTALVITGDKGRIGIDNDVMHFRLRIDPKALPMSFDMDLTNEKGETEIKTPATALRPGKASEAIQYKEKLPKVVGIYKFEGDTMVVALSFLPTARPTEFTANKADDSRSKKEDPYPDGVIVLHLKRGKPDITPPPRKTKTTGVAPQVKTTPTNK